MNRPKLPAARLLLAVASLAVAATLTLTWLRGGSAPEPGADVADGGVLTMLIQRFTREESVDIRIDEEQGMRVARRVESPFDGKRTVAGPAAASGAGPVFSDDWVVLDHRWLGTGQRAKGGTMSYVGASMGTNGHVTVTPPFVVLTRGEESILLRMESGRTVSVDEPMPSWVRSDPDSGLVLARFDGFGDAAIGDGTVRLQRRFFAW